MLWCTRMLVCLSFSLSNSFFCALWCFIQVIVHVLVDPENFIKINVYGLQTLHILYTCTCTCI